MIHYCNQKGIIICDGEITGNWSFILNMMKGIAVGLQEFKNLIGMGSQRDLKHVQLQINGMLILKRIIVKIVESKIEVFYSDI